MRADKNIAEVLSELTGSVHRLRLNSIDDVLFAIVSDFEALTVKNKNS